MITFRQLEIFSAIVKSGSFRRCADSLGISPEAVSANIRSLETQLGYLLFDRHIGGHPTLTKKGERAYHHSCSILDDVQNLYDASGQHAPRRILIGAHPFIMRYLQDGIKQFRTDHPDLTLDLDLDGRADVDFPDRVDRHLVDLAYFFAHAELGQPIPCDCAWMRDEPLAMFTASDHPLAGRKNVRFSELTREPVVHLSRRTSLRPLIDDVLSSCGLADCSVAVETDDYGLVLTSVGRGSGYVCMFASVAEEVREANGLVMLDMAEPLPSLSIWRAVRDLRRNAMITTLEAHLRRSFAD